jgi:hypothetical protein
MIYGGSNTYSVQLAAKASETHDTCVLWIMDLNLANVPITPINYKWHDSYTNAPHW